MQIPEILKNGNYTVKIVDGDDAFNEEKVIKNQLAESLKLIDKEKNV